MYATKSLELTTKASEILRLINKANDRIDALEQKVFEYENTSDIFAEVRLFNGINDLKASRARAYKAKERLVKYYGATVMRIVYNGLKQNVFEYLDKPIETKTP